MTPFLTGEPPVVLCLASSAVGGDLIRELHEHGCAVVLLTTDALKGDEHWPREALVYVHGMPELSVLTHVVNGVSWLARSHGIGRIIALDDRDLGMVAALREHLNLQGDGVSAVRPFRDRLTARVLARARRLPVPQFSSLFNDAEVRRWTAAVSPPWMLKPRATSMPPDAREIGSEQELWQVLGELGDDRSRYLLERVVPGERFSASGVIAHNRVRCLEVHAGEGHTLDRRAITELVERLVASLDTGPGPIHVECVRGEDGRYRLIELAARLGDEGIVQLVETATGLNLWREWARAEIERLEAQRQSKV